MIFVTLGSQKFQFNRLLKQLDILVESGVIQEEIFAQTGYSDYIPQNYKFKAFLDRTDFENIMNECSLVVTHGGTGAIVGALKKGKKVIAVPRLCKFNEHVDDHQKQIVEQFTRLGFIASVEEIENLEDIINKLPSMNFKSYVSNTRNFIQSIDEFIRIGT